MKKLLLAVFILCALHAGAQLPETMVYIFNVQKTSKGYNFLPPKIIKIILFKFSNNYNDDK